MKPGETRLLQLPHKDPFSFRPFARLVFSANEMPDASDPSFAYHRRWIILPFPNTFVGDARIRDLRDRLTQPGELSCLLNRALVGLRRLWEAQEFTIPPASAAALAQYWNTTDTVKAFVEAACELRPEARVGKQNLFDAYRKWCHDSDLQAARQQEFNARLRKQHGVEDIVPRGEGDKRIRSWYGIGLLTAPGGNRGNRP